MSLAILILFADLFSDIIPHSDKSLEDQWSLTSFQKALRK